MLCVDRYGISTLPCDKLKIKNGQHIMRVSCTLKYIHTHY